MSKTRSILQEINAFLNSHDQSDSPAMRKIASEFANACAEVDAGLTECGRLLDQGEINLAVEKNRSVTPSILDRAEKLRIDKFSEWAEICRDYGWKSPAEISNELILKLKKACNTELELAPLMQIWRKIAKNGLPAQKLAVLRKISNHFPKNNTWVMMIKEQEKLRHVELLNEARTAIEANNLDRLEKIYREMTSPELLIPPEKRPLAKIARIIKDKHIREAGQKANELLKTLENVYRMKNYAGVENAMANWDRHCKEPNFTPDNNQLTQVQDARKWFEEEQAKRQKEANRQTWIKEIEILLNEKDRDITRIEEFHYKLQANNMEVPTLLAERIEEAKEEQTQGEKRKTINRIFLAAAIILVVGFISYISFSFYETKIRRESAVAQLKDAVQDLDFERGLAVAENLPKELSDAPEIVALTKDLAQIKDDRTKKDEKFAILKKELEKFVRNKNVENSRCDFIITAMKKLQNPDKKAGHELAVANLGQQVKDLREEFQRRRDEDFKHQYESLIMQFDKFLRTKINDQKDIAGLKAAQADLNKKISKLGSLSRITPSTRQKYLQVLNKSSDTLKSIIDNGIYRLELIEKVWSAGTPAEYQKMLDLLKKNSSADWKKFSRVYPMLDAYKAACLVAETWPSGSGEPPEKLIADIAGIKPSDNVWAKALNPGEQAGKPAAKVGSNFEKIKAINQTLKMFAENCCKLYEVVFTDKDGGKVYRFYCPVPPERASRKSRRLKLKVKTRAEDEKPRAFEFQYQRIMADEKWQLISAPTDAGALPKFLYNLNYDVLAGDAPPVAIHYLALKRICGDVDNALARKNKSGLKEVIPRYLKKIVGYQGNMNPMIRLLICRDLLKMLAELVPFAKANINEEIKKLEVALPPPEDLDWRSPYPQNWAGRDAILNRAVANINLKRINRQMEFYDLFRRLTFSRKIKPVAKLAVENGKNRIVFQGMEKPDEIWSLDRQRDGTVAFNILALKKDNYQLDEKNTANQFNGQMLFAPYDFKSTEAYMEQLRKQAKKWDIDINWTAAWPGNLQE